MNLLAPLLLLGLVGLALPVIAHLRGRREPRRILFAGHRFLAARGEIQSQRQRLRDRSLLALRLLLLALVIIALSRPVSRHETTLAVLSEAHDAILLVDGSRSMGLRLGDRTLLAATAEVAATIADALPAGSRLGLIGSDPLLPTQSPSADPQAALDALEIYLEGGAPRPGS
ncbi:MAG TPA: VWA domain-containing protein, partial [Nannocystis exedens]|nr:VWA domain-containing protein [Nannocystis exedens]